MNEKELSSLFTEFLQKTKNYPNSSLLRLPPAYAVDSVRVQADLLILDTRIGDYIGLVEFSERIDPDIKRNAVHTITNYLKAIKAESLPFYLVYPVEPNDFQILAYEDNDWQSITHDEFPEFETLSTTRKIEEKAIAKENEILFEKQIQRKNEIKSKYSIWTLASLSLGIITAILTFYLGTADDNLLQPSRSQQKDLQEQLNALKQKINQQITAKTIYVKDSSSNFKLIDNRLKIIEKGLLDNPKKSLEISDIYNQIEILDQKIENQNELINLRNENLSTRIEWLNALVVGLILALLSVSIGYVLTNRSESKNNR